MSSHPRRPEAVDVAAAQSRGVSEALQRALEPLWRFLPTFPKDAHSVQRYLADRGWYLPANNLPVEVFSHLRQLIDEGRKDRVEESMQDLARSRIDDILLKVGEHWPKRLPILEDAFEAHRQGKYTLSIPATLAQADGVSSDVLEVSLFSKIRKTGEPKTKAGLKKVLAGQTILGTVVPLCEESNILLDPLRKPTSVLENTKEVDRRREFEPEYGPLNRHAVLHGLDVTYPTESNSLRAILLIGYLVEVQEILLAHEEDVSELRRIIDDRD